MTTTMAAVVLMTSKLLRKMNTIYIVFCLYSNIFIIYSWIFVFLRTYISFVSFTRSFSRYVLARTHEGRMSSSSSIVSTELIKVIALSKFLDNEDAENLIKYAHSELGFDRSFMGIGNFMFCRPTWYTPQIYGYTINWDIVVMAASNDGDDNSMTSLFYHGNPFTYTGWKPMKYYSTATLGNDTPSPVLMNLWSTASPLVSTMVLKCSKFSPPLSLFSSVSHTCHCDSLILRIDHRDYMVLYRVITIRFVMVPLSHLMPQKSSL